VVRAGRPNGPRGNAQILVVAVFAKRVNFVGAQSRVEIADLADAPVTALPFAHLKNH
jgi:hypothetical protein